MLQKTDKFFDYLKIEKEIKNTKIILYGQSLGTQIATHLAKEILKTFLCLFYGAFTFSQIWLAVINLKLKMLSKNILFRLFCKEDIKLVSVPKILIHRKHKDIPLL
jgi:hypothetical protein